MNTKRKTQLRSFLAHWILKGAVPVLVFFSLVGSPAQIQGSSMFPRLREGQYIWNWTYARFTSLYPKFQDIVTFYPPLKSPYGLEKGLFGLKMRPIYIKRILGLPGDTLEIRKGFVYRNGERVKESYISLNNPIYDMKEIILKGNEYFVLGDNRLLGESIDSRYFGPIKHSDLLGKVN